MTEVVEAVMSPSLTAEQELIRLGLELFPANLDQGGVAFPNPLEVRKKIHQFEDAMNRASDIQLQIKTTHHFTNGIYAREIFIPKGTILVGRIHRHSCVSIMSMGDKTVVTEDGAMRLKAPFATVSRPGIKRIGIAHEDSIWITIHATQSRDLEEVERELFTEDYTDIKSSDLDVLSLVTMEGKLWQE